MKKIAFASFMGLALAMSMVSMARADADPPKAWQDVRALVVRFNDAQNAHNLDVIGALLVNSPDFVWAVGPTVQHGRDAALGQLAAMYQAANWSVLPDYGALNIQLLGDDQADVTLPTQFKATTPLQDTTMQAVVHERAIKTSEGWRLSAVAVQPQPAAAF